MVYVAYRSVNAVSVAEQSSIGRDLLYRLAEYVGFPLNSADILIDENGRPYVKDKDEVDFNISHSSSLVVCALSIGGGRVGIDTEPVVSGIPEERMEKFANRYFSREEMGRFNDDRSLFSKIWTEKEALLKRSGKGLAGLKESNSRGASESIKFEGFEVDGGWVTVCLDSSESLTVVKEL